MYNSWVEVSKSAILHNLMQYKSIIGNSVELMPIIKSNAYGHGMVEVAKLLSPHTTWIGVVSLGEALELRNHGIASNIFVLSYIEWDIIEKGLLETISLPVYNIEQAEIISAHAVKLGVQVSVHLKLDIGTTRVGVLPADFLHFAKAVAQLQNITIEGIYGHFAASEDNQTFTLQQLTIFRDSCAALEQVGIVVKYKHVACSAAILTTDDALFTMARLGVSLYGLWPSEHARTIAQTKYPAMNLLPALTWKTTLLQVKDIVKGTSVGYGCTYKASHDMRIGVVAAGYFEGYHRGLSNKSSVLVNGKRCKVIGVICMNMFMIELKDTTVTAGDEVVLLGKQRDEEITASELAGFLNTIHYEIVTQINPLLERVYVD